MKTFKRQNTIEAVIEELEKDLNCEVYFDDSRAWSLYTYDEKYTKGKVGKFGAYRDYLGGGIRGNLKNNGRADYGTSTSGKLFESALKRIEEIYNQGYEDSESWEKPTGVIL